MNMLLPANEPVAVSEVRPLPWALCCAVAAYRRAQLLIVLAIAASPTQGAIVCGIGQHWNSQTPSEPALQSLAATPSLPPADTLPEPVVVDTLFLYTPQAVAGAGSEGAIQANVFESVAEANARFTNSHINVRIQPVFIGRIDYTESGSIETDLAALANSQGALARAALLRNYYKADIVCLITELENLGIGGLAWDIPPLQGNANGAFFAMRRAGIGGLGKGSMVMAHELGHLFGCHHDREHAGDLAADWLKQRRSYIFGHRLQIEGVTYIDVMSYEPGIYLPYFANPRLELDGVRLGVPEGESLPSDPARTINETAPYVARYREALSRIEFEFAIYEINEKSGRMSVGLKRSGNLNSSTRVTVAIEPASTAKPDRDYLRPETTVITFAANQSQAAFELQLVVDDVEEPAETLILSLIAPGGNHGLGWISQTTVTIHDEQQPIAIIPSQSFRESDGAVTIRVEPSRVLNYPSTVRWRVEGGTAKPGVDYVEARGELASSTWVAPIGLGFTTFRRFEPLRLTLLDDGDPEGDEQLRVIIEGATVEENGQRFVYAPVTNVVRIVDDDHPGSLTEVLGPRPPPIGGLNLAVRADGNFLVWSGFTPGKSLDRLSFALIEPNGARDPDFATTEFVAGHRPIEGVGSAQISTVRFLPDGKFLVAGQFSRVQGKPRSTLAQLNANGTLDEAFGRQLSFDGVVLDLAIQPDSRILAGGSFEKVNGKRRPFIARLHPDGSIDDSFKPNGGPTSDWTVHIYAVTLQPDGKILIGGYFKQVDGSPALNFARLLPDGQLDPTFKLKNVSGPVTKIATQVDGRIVLAGLFETVSGRTIRKLARVFSDGSIDNTFRPPRPNGDVRELIPLPDGRLLVSGAFTTIASANRRFIALLNADGSINEEFDPGAGPDQLLGPLGSLVSSAMSIHADGSLYLAGQFAEVNGLPGGAILRLKLGDPGSALSPPTLDEPGKFTLRARMFPGGQCEIQTAPDLTHWSLAGELPSAPYDSEVSATLPLVDGHRFFRLQRRPGESGWGDEWTRFEP